MKRKHLTRRLIAGMAMTGLLVTGLAQTSAASEPAPAQATNLAQGKPVQASSHVHEYVATNANDGNVNSYWESAGYPGVLTVDLGADADLDSVVVKLNPDPIWQPRTQTFEVLGRAEGSGSFTTLAASAGYAFHPANNQNTVTIPVSGRAAELRLAFTGNTEAPGGQVAELEVFGTPAPAADIAVTGLSWAPGAPAANDDITVSATVENTGSAASEEAALEVRLSGSAAGSGTVPALAPGGSAVVAVDIGSRSAGSYSVSAHTGGSAYTAPQQLVVGQIPGPDLAVASVSATPPNPAVGAEVGFSVTVENRGTTDVQTTTVTRLEIGSTTLDTDTPPIDAGEAVTLEVDGTWTATDGPATVLVTADATDLVAETDETNNQLSQPLSVGRGAALPYVEYEAEDADYDGTLLVADAERTFGKTNFATESSGRESVRLNSTGEYVEFTSVNQANSIVVRNSIPDAPGGGGIEASISLYIDGSFDRKLTLSSKHSWLYGSTDDPEGLTNTPGGDARRLFDESHALLGQSYPPGTTFRLQRDADDTADFYIIDLIDLEQVAPPSAKPAECTSITEYGAVPDDGIDDTDAIQAAVTDNQNGVIDCVWIPAGQWRQEQKILTEDPEGRGQFNQVGIRDVTIRGAGMWHSQFYTLTPPHDAGGINHPHEGNFGFDIDDNVQISDIAIFGSGTIRGGDGNHEGGVGLNGRFGENTSISNVWIEHANVGVWVGRDYDNIPALWGPADGLEFSGMRIRNTYADGINFSNGTRNSTVSDSSFRNTGDDALAVWANPYVADPSVDIGHSNTFRNNTIQLPWRANGIAIYGGYDNSAINNVISDTMNYPGIMVSSDHNPLPFSGETLLSGNTLHRTGGAFWGAAQEFGAITLFASGRDVTGVTIEDTEIYDSTYDGIQFKTGGGAMPDVAIRNVVIDKSNNGAGILAHGGARGNATLENVTITDSATGHVVIEPGSQFTITGSPN